MHAEHHRPAYPHRPALCSFALFGWTQNGLRLGYAYTVLDAADVGEGNRLVHLRGPLPAKEGWAGQWAEDSPRWTPEALSRLRSGSTSNHLRYR